MSSLFQISGFSEAVVIVRSAEPHLLSWVGAGGWELRHQGAVDTRLLHGWGLPVASGEEWLLSHPGCDGGRVRLLQLKDAGKQVDMRADDQCWDIGGLFDLNVRVLDMQRQSEALRSRYWTGASPPVQWNFGALTVKEWLVRGPDNVRLALIERVHPALTGLDWIRGLGPLFNSSQIVPDLDLALRFYTDVLGFQLYASFTLDQLPPGANVFGIPPGLATQTGLQLHILHPQGKNEGSIEIVSLSGTQGLDWSAHCHPPNYGMATLRFPVCGLPALARHLTAKNADLVLAPTQMLMPPYGTVQLLTLRAPGGVWLEFFEPIQ